jgi:hypothetical protein
MRQLVGCRCAICGLAVESVLEGHFCEDCGNPVHGDCVSAAPGDGDPRCPSCGADLSSHPCIDLPTFLQKARELLHPRVYPLEPDYGPGSYELLLVHRSWLWLGRYALAIYRWDPSRDGHAQVRAARREIGKQMWAVPMDYQVGLYLVFCGPAKEWVNQVGGLSADQTGLHGVIVQGIHCVDPKNGRARASHSRIGPFTFGGAGRVNWLLSTIYGGGNP